MNLDEIKKECLVLDCETSAHYSSGKEININADFDGYLQFAKCKFFGAYSYKYNKEYYLEVSKNRQEIMFLFENHEILVGFNNQEFDFPILQNNGLIDRGKFYTQVDCMQIMGKSTFKDKKGFSYKGRGELMDYKFKNNKLSTMAEVMKLDFQKGDIDYKIFQQDSWNKEEISQITTYLKNDVMATMQIFDKLWEYWKPFTELLDHKSIKNLSWIRSSIASLTYKSACFTMNVEPTYGDGGSKKEEMGGYVLEPVMEEKTNVFYVDWSSLYPHIFVMFNLFSETTEKDGRNIWHGNDLFKTRGYYNISSQHILAESVQERLKERLELKKNNPSSPMIYALKIWLNALYGCVRSSIFERVHTENAGFDCCYLGQQINKLAKDEFEKFGFKTIYQDSVCKDTPIFIKYQNQLKLIPIEDLFLAPKTNSNRKIFLENKNILIWTDQGWSKIKYIYRHKIKKQMYKILTRKGYIEVSEDHSLIINNKSIKPSSLNIGNNIEIIDFKLPEKYNIDKDLSWLLGFWLAEGTTGLYKYKSSKKYSWALSQKIKLPLIRAQKILLRYGINTKILNTLKSSNCYKLVPSMKNNILIYELFKEWCLTKLGDKKIPSFILESDKKSKKAFLNGYLLGDGHVGKKDKIIAFGSIDKSLMAGICSIFNSLNYEYSLQIRPDKPNFISGRIIRNKNDKRINKKNKILKIEKFTNNDYIYDIETKNHHFCGGVGNVNLHNTDSSFIYHIDDNKNNEIYLKECLEKIVAKIAHNVPFPSETFSLEIENFLTYIMFPFSDQTIIDEETGKNVKKGNRLVKERKGRKKNYAYIYEKNGEKVIKLVGLPIKKDNATQLGIKIYKEFLEPKILETNQAKFEKTIIDNKIGEYLKKKEIMTLMSREFKIKPYNTYKVPKGKTEPSSIYAQISKGYFNKGDGIINLIKNRKIGKAGKGMRYCDINEAIEAKLTIDDLDLEKVYNELGAFIKYEDVLTKS